jgi:hypothetical protein
LPILNAIIKNKEKWRRVQESINYVKKNGYLPTEIDKEKDKVIGASVAELKVSIVEIAPKISKLKKNLTLNPDSKKADGWQIELSRLVAIKSDILLKIEKLRNERA